MTFVSGLTYFLVGFQQTAVRNAYTDILVCRCEYYRF